MGGLGVRNRLAGLLGDIPVLQAGLLCRSLSWNQRGELSIHNEFDTLQAGIPQDFLVVSIWRGGAGSMNPFYEKVELLSPSGHLLGFAQFKPFQISEASERHINYTRFERVVFPEPGSYLIRVGLYNAPGSFPLLEFEHFLRVVRD